MPTDRDETTEQQIKKLDEIRALGADPYPHGYHRTHTSLQAVSLLEKIEAGTATRAKVDIAGRIMANRSMGKSAFLDLRDDSGKIQLLFQNINQFDEKNQALFKDIDIGDIIGIKGEVLRTRTQEPTVRVAEFTLLAKSLRPLPEKWHGLSDVDIRYRQRYLDLISSPEVGESFKVRSQVISGIRSFLNKKGFLEVETPVLLPHAGGALARPFVTHHFALDQDFYLRIATELHLKRLIVGGFEKVYEIARTFRNEGISTRHNPEFTMLESYEAYADYNDVMKMVEEMVSTVAQQVLGTTEIKYGEETIDVTPPWPRVSLREAVKKHSGIDFVKHPSADGLRDKMRSMKIEADADKNWAKLVDELLSTCVKPKIIQPTFLVDYPVSMSPLAKSKPGEDRVVERFQAFAGGGLEFANAYSELNDPIEQRHRFEEQMKERQGDDTEKWTIDEDFLTALEYGMPPTGGLGIGIDRLVMLFTNHQSIREVILFPQLRDKA